MELKLGNKVYFCFIIWILFFTLIVYKQAKKDKCNHLFHFESITVKVF